MEVEKISWRHTTDFFDPCITTAKNTIKYGTFVEIKTILDTPQPHRVKHINFLKKVSKDIIN